MSTLMRLATCLAAIPLYLASAIATAQPGPAAGLQKVRFSLNPGQVIYLPLFVAIDRGHFRREGLDVQVLPYRGSANTQMPLLARGDVDISSVIAGPAMFNQLAEGFRIKLVATLTQPRQGYQDGVVLVVRKDLWDAGAIRSAADLKGRKVDGAAKGNPIDFLLRSTLRSAGLGESDVTLSYKPRTPADTPEILRQKVVDVAGVSEPTATLIESQGVGVRWLSYKDVVPWYQETYLAASEAFLRDRPEAVRRFLAGYLKAVKEVSRSQGKWTPELLAIATRWTGMPAELLNRIGGLPYWDADASVDLAALVRVQDFWAAAGLVRKPVDAHALVALEPLQQARRATAD